MSSKATFWLIHFIACYFPLPTLLFISCSSLYLPTVFYRQNHSSKWKCLNKTMFPSNHFLAHLYPLIPTAFQTKTILPNEECLSRVTFPLNQFLACFLPGLVPTVFTGKTILRNGNISTKHLHIK